MPGNDMNQSSNIIKRALYAYIGMIICIILLIPFAFAVTLGGHSLMYVIIFGSVIVVSKVRKRCGAASKKAIRYAHAFL